MSSRSALVRAVALVLLPLAAFLLGPALDAVAPESRSSDRVVLSVLPTVLPLTALVVVAVASYRRTRSTVRTLRLTALAFVVAVLGAIAYLLYVWSEASGS